jgi:hypothetical protein
MKFSIKISFFLASLFFNASNLESDFIMSMAADLDSYDLQIGYTFSGGHLTLFGTKNDEDSVLIKVTGPDRDFLLNKRRKVSGLWLKRDTTVIDETSSYIATWISPDLKRKSNIAEFYKINPFQKNINSDYETKNQLKDEFNQYMLQKNRYLSTKILQNSNNNLFKINIPLSSNSAIGRYIVNVTSFNYNRLMYRTTLSFDVMHSAFNNLIYDLNKNYNRIYSCLIFVASIINIIIIRYLVIKN